MLMKKFIFSFAIFSVVLFSLIDCANLKKVTTSDLDMSDVTDVDQKKKRFFDFMRPIIIDENAKVLALREQLIDAKKNNDNAAFVAETAESYSVEWGEDEQDWNKLLERVDAISLEVALRNPPGDSQGLRKKEIIFLANGVMKKTAALFPKSVTKDQDTRLLILTA